MESFNGNAIRIQEKVVRRPKREDSTIPTDLRLYHTYVYSAPHAVRLRALLPTAEYPNRLYLIDVLAWRLYWFLETRTAGEEHPAAPCQARGGEVLPRRPAERGCAASPRGIRRSRFVMCHTVQSSGFGCGRRKNTAREGAVGPRWRGARRAPPGRCRLPPQSTGRGGRRHASRETPSAAPALTRRIWR